MISDLVALRGLDKGRNGPAELQREDEGVALLDLDVGAVVVVQLHHDALRLLPALEGISGALAGAIWCRN